jgi:hypothetical protein
MRGRRGRSARPAPDGVQPGECGQAMLGDSVKPIFDACLVQLVELDHVPDFSVD